MLAERDATKSRNGEDSHDPGTGVRRQVHLARKTIGYDFSYAMTWTNLKKKMTDKYYSRGEIKKLEVEMWNMKVKDKIERYVGSLPDMIHESVMASKPKTMQDAIEFTTELMDKKISTLAERQAENKRKLDNNNQTKKQPPKKKGMAIAYTIRTGERNESDCPELKNQNYGNQAGGTGARGMVDALRGGENNQDLNDMEDDINA
nr:hypothetical protein [Tanacetum cinerariifolium]